MYFILLSVWIVSNQGLIVTKYFQKYIEKVLRKWFLRCVPGIVVLLVFIKIAALFHTVAYHKYQLPKKLNVGDD